MTPVETSEILRGLGCPWWIAGGWAIDLHAGRQTRPHADIDILIIRDDQLTLQHELRGWDLYAAEPPGTLRYRRPGEILPAGVHDVWCRRSVTEPWCLEVMIDDATNGVWTYRRDERVSRIVAELDGPASNGVRRILAPEVQLLYKSNEPRAKEEADFEVALQRLDAAQRRWLRDCLSPASPGTTGSNA